VSCCRPGRRSLVLGVFSRPAVDLTRHFHPEPLQVTGRDLLDLGVPARGKGPGHLAVSPALGYLFLISLITTGIAHTTPAVALIMAVIVSANATWAHLSVRTADRRQVIKDRGRHMRSPVDGRILEDKPHDWDSFPASRNQLVLAATKVAFVPGGPRQQEPADSEAFCDYPTRTWWRRSLPGRRAEPGNVFGHAIVVDTRRGGVRCCWHGQRGLPGGCRGP
jgi:hypothetical protein